MNTVTLLKKYLERSFSKTFDNCTGISRFILGMGVGRMDTSSIASATHLQDMKVLHIENNTKTYLQLKKLPE